MLLRRYQARWLVIAGVLTSAAGLLVMSKFNLYVDYRTAAWARVLQSSGLAFLFVPISTMAFALIPRERMNYATGLFNLARNIGGSAGIATITTLLARRGQYHQTVLVANLTPYSQAYRDALQRTTLLFQAHGSSSPDAGGQAQALLYGNMLRQSNMLAFSDGFWIMAVLFLAIIPLMFLMRKIGPVKGPMMVE
jgi:DHA2 family multidrug resistance protein